MDMLLLFLWFVFFFCCCAVDSLMRSVPGIESAFGQNPMRLHAVNHPASELIWIVRFTLRIPCTVLLALWQQSGKLWCDRSFAWSCGSTRLDPRSMIGGAGWVRATPSCHLSI